MTVAGTAACGTCGAGAAPDVGQWSTSHSGIYTGGYTAIVGTMKKMDGYMGANWQHQMTAVMDNVYQTSGVSWSDALRIKRRVVAALRVSGIYTAAYDIRNETHE